MRENKPPRGVASLMGLDLSSTLWAMLNRSTAFRARRGRALQPVALSLARERAITMANRKSQEKITTQARRDWEDVVGRGTPKKIVEVEAEAGAAVATDLVWDERGGQAANGEAGGPLPCASALGAPPAGATLLKLYRGREVKPGHMAASLQELQAGTLPKVPLGQPRQETLCASASASVVNPANAEGRRGEGQVRGAQSARVEAEARRGCWPAGQEKGRARHCESCVAPVEVVVFPVGQTVHCDCANAPWTAL